MKKHIIDLFVGIVIAAVWLSAISDATSATFQGLGFLNVDDTESFAFGVSDDGSVVVGSSDEFDSGTSTLIENAYRWTANSLLQDLGRLQASNTNSVAWGASGDGSVVVGQDGIFNFNTGFFDSEGFRWTEATNSMQGLGHLNTGDTFSGAYSVSSDGSVVVGESVAVDQATGEFIGGEAFRWTTATNSMQGLGFLNASDTFSTARDVSSDGSVVVGESGDSNPGAFRWTAGTGLQPIALLNPGDTDNSALAVSSDGTTVVGFSGSFDPDIESFRDEAYRWASGAPQGLGYLVDGDDGDTFSIAVDVTGDGSVVVGQSGIDTPSLFFVEPFIWDEKNGMRSLRDVLENDFDLAAELLGWQLDSVEAISADGRTIVGIGINPSDDFEAFVAVIPEPSTSLLLAGGAIVLGRRRHRRVLRGGFTRR